MMEAKNKSQQTSGEKLKSARKEAGLTQEQLAVKLMVSRQAITKWETDKGMPDIENLKSLSQLLGVSVDYLLDNGEHLDLSVMREKINLEEFAYERKLSGRWNKKAGKKDMVVRSKYPNAKIHYLMAKQIATKGEKIMDNVIGFLTDAPFGLPDIINGMKNTDKEFYLIDDADKQYFVTVYDEFIESRQLSEKITARKFEIDNFSFVDCGIIPETGTKS